MSIRTEPGALRNPRCRLRESPRRAQHLARLGVRVDAATLREESPHNLHRLVLVEPRDDSYRRDMPLAVPFGFDALVRRFLPDAVALVAVGLLAIGASGVLAAGADAAFGARFVAGDLPGITYTAARCAELREYAPSATSCEAAAAAHHTTEVIWYRIAAGVAGIGLLAVWWSSWRRRRTYTRSGLLAVVGTATFGLAAAALGALALDALIQDPGRAGAGQWLTASLVAAIVATFFGARVVADLVAVPAPAG